MPLAQAGGTEPPHVRRARLRFVAGTIADTKQISILTLALRLLGQAGGMTDTIASLREAVKGPAGVCLALGLAVLFVLVATGCVAAGEHHTFGQDQAGVGCALVLLMTAATAQLIGLPPAFRVAARARPWLASRPIGILDPPPKRLLSR